MAHLSGYLQDGIVAAIVVAAFVYATAKLLPGRSRAAFARSLATVAEGVGLSTLAARRIETKLASAGACGSCDSCNACAKPAAPEPPTAFRSIPIRRVDR